MCLVFLVIAGVDEDIVKVNNDIFIKEVGERVVHESLKGCQSIGETLGDHTPLEGAIASTEGSLPFVAFSDSDKMIRVSEIDLGVDTTFLGGVEEILDERKWISIFLGDVVDTAEIDTETETSILFLGEQDRSSKRRSSRANEAHGDMVIQKLAECLEFHQR
jgi:hypothetical protein